MPGAIRFLLLVPVLAGLAGCGTILRGRQEGLYPAVKWDADLIATSLEPVPHSHDERPSEALLKDLVQGSTFLFGVLDTPISAIFDTLLLPYDWAVSE